MSSRSEVNYKIWPKGIPCRGVKYFRYLLRKYWYVSSFWIFVYLIPAYHTLTCEIPSQENLQLTQGTLSFERQGKSGTILLISGENGNEYYTCRSSVFGSHHNCIWRSEKIKALTGKTAKVWWFEQNIFLGFSQRRLVHLIVEDHEEFSIQTALRWNERDKSSSMFFLIFSLAFFVFIVFLFERTDIRKSKEKPTHG